MPASCVVCGDLISLDAYPISQTLLPTSQIPLMFKIFETLDTAETSGSACETCFEIFSDLDSTQVRVKHILDKLVSRRNKVESGTNSAETNRSQKIKYEADDDLEETGSPLDVWGHPASGLPAVSEDTFADSSAGDSKSIKGAFEPETVLGQTRKRRRAVKTGKTNCKCDGALSYQQARKSTFDHEAYFAGVLKDLFGFENGRFETGCCSEIEHLQLSTRTEALVPKDRIQVINVILDYMVKHLKERGFESFDMLPSNWEITTLRTKIAEIFDGQEWAMFDGRIRPKCAKTIAQEAKDGFFVSLRERRRYLKDLEKRTCSVCYPFGADEPFYYMTTELQECVKAIFQRRPHWEDNVRSVTAGIIQEMLEDFASIPDLVELDLTHRSEAISSGDWYKVCECFGEKAMSYISRDDLPTAAREKKLYLELIPLLARSAIADKFPTWGAQGTLGYGSLKFKDREVVMNEKMYLDMLETFKTRIGTSSRVSVKSVGGTSRVDSIIDSYLE